MQLMKQNGIQVNNNNSNSADRLSSQQHSPNRAAAQARGLSVRGSLLFVHFYYDKNEQTIMILTDPYFWFKEVGLHLEKYSDSLFSIWNQQPVSLI